MEMLREVTAVFLLLVGASVQAADFDVLIRNGLIYDGTGTPAFEADLGIDGDRIVAIGMFQDSSAEVEIDASGLAVSPGFINMLSHAHLSLLKDGRSMSDVMQGVTLEVLSELSFSPLVDSSVDFMRDLSFYKDIDFSWRSLAEYLEVVERSGSSANFGTFVSAATVRMNVLGMDDKAPTNAQLEEMKRQVDQAMREGAFGLATALIYAPAFFATTEELIELAKVAARHGGIYTAHMRSESNQLTEAIEETLRIGREAGIPVKIHHLKAGGVPNWSKIDSILERIDALRRQGVEITADMYTYTAGASGLSAAMPPWVQAGGLEEWITRLQNPEIRERLIAEMSRNTDEWENLGYLAGPDRMLMTGFKNPELQKYDGMKLSEIARLRGQDHIETMLDLVIEDQSRVETTYFLMSEENIKKQIAKPWVMFGSDESAMSPQEQILLKSAHPRAYGNFARLLGKYVREEQVISLTEAIRRLTLLPAQTLGVPDRGRIAPGFYADITIFDPKLISDHATFEDPHRFATGVQHVLVNGIPVVSDGRHTGKLPGRAVRGPGWTQAQ